MAVGKKWEIQGRWTKGTPKDCRANLRAGLASSVPLWELCTPSGGMKLSVGQLRISQKQEHSVILLKFNSSLDLVLWPFSGYRKVGNMKYPALKLILKGYDIEITQEITHRISAQKISEQSFWWKQNERTLRWTVKYSKWREEEKQKTIYIKMPNWGGKKKQTKVNHHSCFTLSW